MAHLISGTPGPVIADRDAPLFALLRSTCGLPVDDPRWWPEPTQQRRRIVLLERTLAALREWDTTLPAPGSASCRGRHEAPPA